MVVMDQKEKKNDRKNEISRPRKLCESETAIFLNILEAHLSPVAKRISKVL